MTESAAGIYVPADPKLPWLATALDRDAMSRHFARLVLPTFAPAQPGRYRLHGCDIDHVRYRPGRNCAIAYRLQVLDTATRAHHDLRFHARMYPPAGAHSRHARAADERLEPAPLGPPLHLIEPLDMVLWAFPNERKLRALGAVLDDGRLASEVLPEVIATGWGPSWQVETLRRDIVHYVPEHALTVRLQLGLRHGLTGERRPVALYGKCQHDDQGAATLRVLSALRTQRQHGLRTPTPLCYQAPLRLLWQEALPGVPLADLLHDEAAVPALMRQAGAQIAALHGARAPVSGQITHGHLLTRVDAAAPVLAGEMGDDAAMVWDLTTALQAQLPAQPSEPVLLHGDLHAKNILVGSQGAGLIDLDSCVTGPASWDLGSFIAALIATDIIQRAPGRACGRAALMLQGYGADHWDAPTHRALDWSVACALVIERALRSVSRLKAGRLRTLPALISAAQRSLHQGWRAAAP